MRKRISIFGLLALLVGVIGFGVMGTGAFFNAKTEGNVNASAGTLSVDKQGTATLDLTATNLFPGVGTAATNATYTVNSSNSNAGLDAYICVKPGTVSKAVDLSQLHLTYIMIDSSVPIPAAVDIDFNQGAKCVGLTDHIKNGDTLTVNGAVQLAPGAQNEWQGAAATGKVALFVQSGPLGPPAGSYPVPATPDPAVVFTP